MLSTNNIKFFVTFSVIFYSLSCLLFVKTLATTAALYLILISLLWSLSRYFWRQYQNNVFINPLGKAVLITGCDTGFGNSVALKLNEHGFMVYATVLDEESDGAKQLTKNAVFPHRMKAIKMDVTDDQHVANAYEEVCAHLLQTSKTELWAIVNNAGIASFGAIDWGTMQLFENVFEVNTYGAIRVTRKFLPLIRKAKGRVVNVASILGRYTGTECAPYSMSKHAIVSFSDALRREVKQFGVRVSTIEPGVFKTNITSAENSTRFLENAWTQTSASVKQVYGDEYFETVKQKMLDSSDRYGTDNIDLVVNAILDAITANVPLIRYTLIDDWITYAFMLCAEYLPTEWIDFVVLYLKN